MVKRLIDDEETLTRSKPGGTRRERPDREPTSWRDKDRAKDRAASSNPENRDRGAAPPVNRFKAEMERKGNLAAAEALFANPARDSLEKKLLAAGPSTMEEVGREYVEKYGLPPSFDILAKLAEHPSAEIALLALEKIEPLLGSQTPPKRQNFLQAVQVVSLSGRDASIKRAASALLRRSTEKNVSS